MRFLLSALGVVLPCLVALAVDPPAAQPTTGPATAPGVMNPPIRIQGKVHFGIGVGGGVIVGGGPGVDNRQQQFAAAKARVAAMKSAGKFKMSDLVRFSLKDGLMAATWIGPQFEDRQTLIEIEGTTAVCVVNQFLGKAHRLPAGIAANDGSSISLIRYDFERPKRDQGPWQVGMNCSTQYFSISSMYLAPSHTVSASYSQGPNGVYLSVSEFPWKPVPQLHGENLTKLQQQHPDEVRQYVAPLLLEMTGVDWLSPGAADVYRVFDTIQPSAEAVKKMQDVLTQMDSPDFAQREAASKQLSELGRPGVLAAMRVDPQTLMPEQKNRLSAFVATFVRREITDPAVMRNDRNFLFDALLDEDVAVRQEARAALEKWAGHKIDLDVSQRDPALDKAVDALRQKLTERTTTAPSEGESRPGPVN